MIIQVSYSPDALVKLKRSVGFSYHSNYGKPAWVKLEELLVVSGFKLRVEIRERADLSKREADYLHLHLGKFFLENKA